MRRSVMRQLAVTAYAASILLVLGSANTVAALPFNTDMLDIQLSDGQISRPQPPGSVAVGSLQRQKPDDKTPWAQKNPLASNVASEQRGARKFQANCMPCHGEFKDGQHQPSPIAARGLAIPSVNLADPAIAAKNDNHFFTYIFNGGPLMPAYGFRLGNDEIWDIVSYVRSEQARAGKPSK